jgi:hypothetical protein
MFRNADGAPAFVIWEVNGPGQEFGKRIVNDGFRNIYMREAESALYRKKTEKAGWYSTSETKRVLLSDYKTAVMHRQFWNPCKQALEECGEYVHRPSGVIEHSRCRGITDPTATGENHGDMVIADALAFKAVKDRGGAVVKGEGDGKVMESPPGSFGWRRREYERSLQRTDKY